MKPTLTVNQVSLLPGHALIIGVIENGPNVGAHSIQFAVEREDANKFEPGRQYEVTFTEKQ